MSAKRGVGRPPKLTEDEYVLLWCAVQNPYVDLHDVAREFGLKRDTVRRIQCAQMKRINDIIFDKLGIINERVECFLPRGGFNKVPRDRVLGTTFVPQPCPPRYQLEALREDHLRKADRDYAVNKRYAAEEMDADRYASE